jgi:hypothetical protein
MKRQPIAWQMPPIWVWRRRQLHVTNLPCLDGEECSLIIPNVSTLGPPTSRAVQVNLGSSQAGCFTVDLPANRVRDATASAMWVQLCEGPGWLVQAELAAWASQFLQELLGRQKIRL